MKLPISDVVEIRPRILRDDRGYFVETFRANWFSSEVAPVEFVQENQSLSMAQGTIRGLHFQSEPFAQGKLVRCVEGAIFDVAVDLRHGSPTYGQWAGATLTAQDCNQLWIPSGFAHGFCTLVPQTVVAYKVTAYYSRENDLGLAWDDPDVNVAWPDVADPTKLSAKDQVQPRLADLPSYFEVAN
nr:dTDP-4-dehydrorhamnose 3,5-epimerase [Novosphingobium nitrogenifigens]